MRRKKWLLLIPILLVILYSLGPNPKKPDYNNDLPPVPVDASSLEKFIDDKEAAHKLRPDNQARIVWANDSLKQKTPYSIVYLHGFSASQGEGEPVHRQVAKRFGCNLYLSRLAEHGIDTVDQLVNLTPEKYWESAKLAYNIGKQLGDTVIVMGTSTGGSLALQLAATYPEINSLVLLSPNIEINDPNAWLLNNPWGLQIAQMVLGSKYIVSKDNRATYKQYWNYPYRIEAAVALQEMLETSMTAETFARVKQPALLLYYYKDEVHQDSVVKVPAMKEMFAQLGTPEHLKRAVSMPNTGDHVLGSYIKSKDVEGVRREIEKFLKEIVKVNSK
jgi:esterase/lipase